MLLKGLMEVLMERGKVRRATVRENEYDGYWKEGIMQGTYGRVTERGNVWKGYWKVVLMK